MRIDAQQTSAIVADQFDLVNNLRNAGLFLDLLGQEPAEQRTGVEVADVSPPPSTDSIA